MGIIKIILPVIVMVGIQFFRAAMRGAALAANNRFACPNCGHRFYAEWYQLMFAGVAVHGLNFANIKCPKCRIKDSCSVVN